MFVDNGLLREGEAEAVVRTFRDTFKISLVHVDAAERFLAQLAGVTDPEDKRKRIGARVHRGLRGGGAEARAISRGWPRARSIRT